MKNKIIIPTILFAVVLILSFLILLKNKESNLPGNNAFGDNPKKEQSQIIFFYGIGCPHCAKVEEFIKENQIEKTIPFVKKEIYFNRQNAKELEEKAKICEIPENEVGVPFLWDGEKCFLGDVDIINFFKEKIGQ